MSEFPTSRSATVGPWTRPVAVPDDVDDPGVAKAAGVVELPLRVRWSGPPRLYDLAVRTDRALLYEQVLTEGTDDDVRFFIVVNELAELWEDLVLPAYVRAAWADWLGRRRDVTVASRER